MRSLEYEMFKMSESRKCACFCMFSIYNYNYTQMKDGHFNTTCPVGHGCKKQDAWLTARSTNKPTTAAG